MASMKPLVWAQAMMRGRGHAPHRPSTCLRIMAFRVLDADRMNLVLADSERSQRMMVLLVLASGLSVSSTRTKSVGQLGYRKDASGVELLSFLLRQARQ